MPNTYLYLHGTSVRFHGFMSNAFYISRFLKMHKEALDCESLIAVPWFLNHTVSVSGLSKTLPRKYSGSIQESLEQRMKDETDELRKHVLAKEPHKEVTEMLAYDPSYLIREELRLKKGVPSHPLSEPELQALKVKVATFIATDPNVLDDHWVKALAGHYSNKNDPELLYFLEDHARGTLRFKNRWDQFSGGIQLEFTAERSLTEGVFDIPVVGPELAEILKNWGTNILDEHRPEAMVAIGKFMGDIFYYKAHAKALFENLTLLLESLDGPVILMGHSLGGIIWVDFLAYLTRVAQTDESADSVTKRHGLAAKVAALITAGSQSALLYEADAMEYLKGDLKTGFPEWNGRIKWLNVYDGRDFLGFSARNMQPLIDSGDDVEIDSEKNFPDSHNQYWYPGSPDDEGLNDFFQQVKGFLARHHL